MKSVVHTHRLKLEVASAATTRPTRHRMEKQHFEVCFSNFIISFLRWIGSVLYVCQQWIHSVQKLMRHIFPHGVFLGSGTVCKWLVRSVVFSTRPWHGLSFSYRKFHIQFSTHLCTLPAVLTGWTSIWLFFLGPWPRPPRISISYV